MIINIFAGFSKWENRTKAAVGALVFFHIFAVGVMGRNIFERYWNRQLNIDKYDAMMEKDPSEEDVAMVKFFGSYYKTRYVYFFPHVTCAIIWWNLYFLQLVPAIRHKYRKLHRISGRVLMVSSVVSAITAVGLAFTNPSATIRLSSSLFAMGMTYAMVNAWYYAVQKDYVKHKHWALRLVGYSQTIAVQRFIFVFFIMMYNNNLFGVYPPFDENEKIEVHGRCFDDSFCCAVIVTTYATEWYMAGHYGWNDSPNNKQTTKTVAATNGTKPKAHSH